MRRRLACYRCGVVVLAFVFAGSDAFAAPLDGDGPYRDHARWMWEVAPGQLVPSSPASSPRFPDDPDLVRFRVSVDRPTGPAVLRAWRPFLAVPPPDSGDTADSGVTPDFRSLQLWLDGDYGIGADEAARYPGGDAGGHSIGDVEYGWEKDHEDLVATADAFAWGFESDSYEFHGTSVLGMLRASQNGFGVDGATAAPTVLVLSPWSDEATYDVGAAVLGAKALLTAGDVLLIEQQGYVNDNYCPVEVDPGVEAAIAKLTKRGIIVVEPGGNGAQDLDDAVWNGAFDRTVQDSGAILVGGGASPLSYWDTRSWTSGGSSFGSRLDMQGWYDSIVTATDGEYDGVFADLYYPGGDGKRAYTQSFNGTSAASPMVAAVALVAESVYAARTGAPLSPADLREAMVSTGLPQPAQDEHVGPQPDLRLWLRTYARP